MGVVLFIISVILLGTVGLLGLAVIVVVGIIALPYNLIYNRDTLWYDISDYFENFAIGIDILGNIVLAPVWNTWLIKEQSVWYKFGGTRDTISGVVGVNEANGNLTKAGKLLARILNKLDPGHTEFARKKFLEIHYTERPK